MGDLIQFIPRAKYATQTDFPTITAKINPTAEYILGLDKNLQANAVEIMDVVILSDPHDAAVYESSLGFIETDKEPGC